MSEYTIEHCPKCGKDVCNGMGPSTMPKVTWILNKTRTGKFFKRECDMHDMDFHLQKGFKKSNKLFKTRLSARVKVTKLEGNFLVRFAKRRWLYRVIPLIIFAVSGKSGRKAYKEGICETLK